jgi:PelA/Pel-15E family pectate lyase
MKRFPLSPKLAPPSFAFALLFLIAAGASPLSAEPVSQERIGALAESERPAWSAYVARSEERAQADRDAIAAELRELGLDSAVRAPSGGDFKVPEKIDPAWYASPETARLADVVLSYQTPGGGWSKHTGYSEGARQRGMLFTSQNEPGQRSHYVATFDNGSTTEQLWLLARVWKATGREDCRTGVLRGLGYILDAQYPHGGWPQVYPLEGGYHDNITLNDNALTNVLELLLAVRDGDPAFAMVEGDFRERVGRALDAGVACLLKLQVERGGKKTVWCQQYDPLTLAPASARKLEPVALSGMESVRVLKFLMSLRGPSPELIASIEAGLAWLEQAKITDVAKRSVGGKTVYQVDPASKEVYWARFYDLATGRPIFPGRDGVVYETFEAMIAKNAGGYDYYTTQPNSLLRTGQKSWRKQLAGGRNPSE